MAKFVQIGADAYNMDLIECVQHRGTEEHPKVLLIPQLTEAHYTLAGEDAKAFIRWWNEHAEVYAVT